MPLPRFLRLCAIATGLVLLAVLRPAAAAELVMLEQPGCAWCLRFHQEIGEAYPKTEESKRAPLRRVDITRELPTDLRNLVFDRFTPTFVLMDGGKELARMRGYAGDEYFWFLLEDMLAKLPEAEASG